jgi:hypothetical protein
VKMLGNKDVRFKIYWNGGKESMVGVGVLLAEWLVNKVVQVERVMQVERVNEILIVKLFIGKHLVNVILA